MINLLNPDHKTAKTEFLPFAPGDLDSSGLRLTRAEFARFMGVSKQAVGEWVTGGKIILGADGRLDPRQAVSQLLRNSDPARIRSRVLAPLMKDIGSLQKRIGELETALAAANEEADYHKGVSLEFLGQQESLQKCIKNERDDLVKLPSEILIDALLAWFEQVESSNCDWQTLSILELISPGALEENKGEGG